MHLMVLGEGDKRQQCEVRRRSLLLDKRLQLLFAGYFRQQGEGCLAPVDVTDVCALYMWFKEVSFHVSKCHSSLTSMLLQIYMGGFAVETGILQCEHIKHYHIDFTMAGNNLAGQATVSKIYPFSCVAFTACDIISFRRTNWATVKVTAVDQDGRVIAVSETQTLSVEPNCGILPYGEEYNEDEIGKFWKQYIVPRSSTCDSVCVDEWVESLTKLFRTSTVDGERWSFSGGADACRRMFYFILRQAGYAPTESARLTAAHFMKIMCTDFNEYGREKAECIQAFRRIIPDFIVDNGFLAMLNAQCGSSRWPCFQ